MGCAAYALPSINQHRKKKTANDERIVLRHADNLRFSENEMNGAQRLSGKVILAHAGMVMHCDSAVLYEASQTFDAFGKVNIVQGDTRLHLKVISCTMTVRRKSLKCVKM